MIQKFLHRFWPGLLVLSQSCFSEILAVCKSLNF